MPLRHVKARRPLSFAASSCSHDRSPRREAWNLERCRPGAQEAARLLVRREGEEGEVPIAQDTWGLSSLDPLSWKDEGSCQLGSLFLFEFANPEMRLLVLAPVHEPQIISQGPRARISSLMEKQPLSAPPPTRCT